MWVLPDEVAMIYHSLCLRRATHSKSTTAGRACPGVYEPGVSAPRITTTPMTTPKKPKPDLGFIVLIGFVVLYIILAATLL